MYKFENSVFIQRSQQEVFDVLTDIPKAAQWQSYTDSAEWTSSGPAGVGSTFKTVGKFMGRGVDTELTVTGWEPPRMISFESTDGPFPVEASYSLEAQDGGTLVTITSQADIGGFFKLAEGLVGKQLKKQVDSNNDTLKLLMESKQL